MYYIVNTLAANSGCLRGSRETNKRDRGKKRWSEALAEIWLPALVVLSERLGVLGSIRACPPQGA